MKIIYDSEADALNIIFNETPVEVSDQRKPGIILDYDRSGNIVSLEILNASRQMPKPQTIEHTVLTPSLKKVVV